MSRVEARPSGKKQATPADLSPSERSTHDNGRKRTFLLRIREWAWTAVSVPHVQRRAFKGTNDRCIVATMVSVMSGNMYIWQQGMDLYLVLLPRGPLIGKSEVSHTLPVLAATSQSCVNGLVLCRFPRCVPNTRTSQSRPVPFIFSVLTFLTILLNSYVSSSKRKKKNGTSCALPAQTPVWLNICYAGWI